MGLHAGKILGIKITIDSKKEILEYIQKSLGKLLIIVTPNPEQIVYAQKDKMFADFLNQADVAIPDGVGVARLLHINRIPGVELMEDLIALAAKQRVPVALIGGYHNLAVKSFKCLSRNHAGLRGWGIEPEQLSIDEIAKKIKKTGIGMVFVGLGAPKQEYFIARLARLAPAVYMSVGGSFEIVTGRIPRAPRWIRSSGFEWAWRLVREPWRWRRQLALVKFLWFIVVERYTSY